MASGIVLIVLGVLAGLLILIGCSTFGFYWSKGFNDIFHVSQQNNHCPAPNQPARHPSAVRSAVSMNSDFTSILAEPWTVSIADQSFASRMIHRFFHRGENILLPNELPFTACTGVIIGKEWVLTAAHCLDKPWSRYWVTAGVDCRPEWGGILQPQAQRRMVVKFYRRFPSRIQWIWKDMIPKFIDQSDNPEASVNDIALLRLSSPLNLKEGNFSEPLSNKYRFRSRSRPPLDSFLPQAIPLATDCSWPSNRGDGVTASGWGMTNAGRYGVDLQSFQLREPKDYTNDRWRQEPIVTRHSNLTEDVLRLVGQQFAHCGETIFCSPVGSNDEQICSGDSGGPWVRYRGDRVDLVGISSTGWSDYLLDYEDAERECGASEYDKAVRVCTSEARLWIRETILADEAERRRRGEAVDGMEVVVEQPGRNGETREPQGGNLDEARGADGKQGQAKDPKRSSPPSGSDPGSQASLDSQALQDSKSETEKTEL